MSTALFVMSITYGWIYYALMAVYALTVIVILCVIVSENRNPVKTLSWVTVLLLMPVVGIVLYLVFGRSIKNTRMISRRNRRRLKRGEKSRPVDLRKQGLSDESLSQIRLARSLTGAIYYPDNDIKVFADGESKFDTLARDLAAAESYINIQYYIFSDDETGRRIADILIERVRAGVTVRLIYDHVGSFHTSRKFFKRMQKAGIQAYPFFKVSFPPFGTRINWRNHRKLCIIDGKIGYIGGMNVADRYVRGNRLGMWRDTHLRIVGPAVGSLQYSFAVDWNFMGRPLIEESLSLPETPAGDMGVQLITSGPTSQWHNVAMMFHHAIAGARKRIYIQSPYFLPTEALLKALQCAALAKVDVRIMMPRRSDSDLLRYASDSYIAECLQAGIKIYLYEGGMLHSKTLIIDDELVSVGSTNFDFRSFEYNFESNLFIYSGKFNDEMVELFDRDMKKSHHLTSAEWRRRPMLKKGAESIVRLTSPIL